MGDRANMTAACIAFAKRGYVAIAPQYRLLGEAPWPAPLTGGRTAIRAARAKAGAHLALIASSGVAGPAGANEPCANHAEAVAGVAAFFPPDRIEAQLGALMGISRPDMLSAMSPITHSGRYPPTILFCGDEDAITPPELSSGL